MGLRKFTSVEIGNNIRRIRVELGQTQEEFGKDVGGYSQDTVAKWEAGQVPHAPVLMKVAEKGRRSVDWILNRESFRRQREDYEIVEDIRRDMAELQSLIHNKRRHGSKADRG
jgi:transcriptional regulator with XRE-family HTH domain